MKIIASAAVSLDGYLDDSSSQRLILSSDEDWKQVYALRAQCDAVLVGAGTLKADNPSLLIRDEDLRAERVARGESPDIIRATLSRNGELDASLNFFKGAGKPVIFLKNSASPQAKANLEQIADTVYAEEITARFIREHFEKRGVRQLLVEGGQGVLSMFFEQGEIDEFRLAVAPFFVADPSAPRLVGNGVFPFDKSNRMALVSAEALGDMAVMYYVADEDKYFLQMALDESRKCTPVKSSYSVGAVIKSSKGEIFKGYTHETSPVNHAEEEALRKAVDAGACLRGATIYSSMEPCSRRRSKPESCSDLIIRHGFARVVFSLYEPSHFETCCGQKLLEESGIEVVVMSESADEVLEINKHILGNSL